jgi:molecular chaperone GrpE (heat shock protein)
MGGTAIVDAASAEAEPGQEEISAPDERDSGLLGEILAELIALKGSFDGKIRYDEAKERQIAALHQELESHRQGLYQQILRPVLTDLVGLYDEIANQAGDGGTWMLEMIEVILERYGVTKYQCDGDSIDRTRQRVIDVQPTGDTELNRRVARRLRPGFMSGGNVLRAEWVIAYRYSASANVTANVPAKEQGNGGQ